MACKLLALLFAIIATAGALKVPLTIYYEALCPDSAKFINEQVFPAAKSELKDHMDITWVPFGKSQFVTQGSDVLFTCHHGPNECYGNKVHACAIEHIQANSYQTEFTRESLTTDFINCMMKADKTFPDSAYTQMGARCAKENQVQQWENILQCANSTEGSVLLKKQGEFTNQFQMPLDNVPTVVFKQHFEPKDNEQAMRNFLSVICKYVSQPQPQICAAGNSAVSISIAPLLALPVYLLSKLF